MEWSVIITSIIGLLSTGGVVYLIVEKLFERKKAKADANTVEIANANDIADLYNKIDEIVERKTAPIKDELSEVKGKLEEIKSNWCCYKEGCTDRIRYQRRRTITEIAEETKNHICK